METVSGEETSTWTPSFYAYDGNVRCLTRRAVSDTYDYGTFGNNG